MTSALDACTEDADCTAADETCGTNSIGTLSVTHCVAMTDCGQDVEIPRSTNTFETACSGDKFDSWTWRTTNEADQTGLCDSSLAEFDAATDECASGTTCGTATMTGFSSYSVLGCYADADCTTAAGGTDPNIPDSTTVTYTLVCGATKLFATAAAAVAVAASI